jgi:hypothetical protein
MAIGIRFLKRHIISVMSKSFDEGSPENNTIKICYFHESTGQKTLVNFM